MAIHLPVKLSRLRTASVILSLIFTLFISAGLNAQQTGKQPSKNIVSGKWRRQPTGCFCSVPCTFLKAMPTRWQQKSIQSLPRQPQSGF